MTPYFHDRIFRNYKEILKDIMRSLTILLKIPKRENFKSIDAVIDPLLTLQDDELEEETISMTKPCIKTETTCSIILLIKNDLRPQSKYLNDIRRNEQVYQRLKMIDQMWDSKDVYARS